MATKKSRQVQTAVLTNEDTLNELDALAAYEGLSRSDVIRRWLGIGRAVEQDKLARAVAAQAVETPAPGEGTAA